MHNILKESENKEGNQTNRPKAQQINLASPSNNMAKVAKKGDQNLKAAIHQHDAISPFVDQEEIPELNSFLTKDNRTRRYRKGIYMGSTAERKCIVPQQSKP